ncbi:helix-turn-helix domain-containing protein [Paenibacillus thermotolerans]|uniref:helix-turn-helix domain-containing protein n=1 Tax=Paenibacillus thermotolerans TaxID=3027807 RepID=UPI00236753C1|nr:MULTISPECIES: helix-turn-helix transcriptional regulator [unclassified Paenibacillus]
MDNYDNLSGKIRAFRKLKGLTQNELADKIGVSVAVLGSVERGTRKADAKLLRSIAEALGIDRDELTG